MHIHVAPAPSPPVEESPDLGASRDWKIIFDVYRDEYKRKESALLASFGKDTRSSSLRPVLCVCVCVCVCVCLRVYVYSYMHAHIHRTYK